MKVSCIKNRFSKLIAIIAAICLLAAIAAGLSACNKGGGNNNGTERKAAVNALKQEALFAVNDKWNADMSDDDAAALADCGDYIIAREWTDYICSVVGASSLPVAKIRNLADALKSDTGKAVIAGEKVKADDLFKMLSETGIIASDVTEIAYSVITGIADNGADVFDKAEDGCIALLGNSQLGSAARVNATAALKRCKEYRVSFAALKGDDNLKSVLDGSRASAEALVEFAYNISLSSLTGNILEALSGGALSDITASELVTYVSAVSRSVGELKSEMADGGLQKLNDAFGYVLDKFGTVLMPTSVVNLVLDYARYAYYALDVLPAALDMLGSGLDAVDKTFVDELIYFFDNSVADTPDGTPLFGKINASIYIAKFIKGAFDAYPTKQAAEEAVSEICSAASGEGKGLTVSYINAALYFYLLSEDNATQPQTDEDDATLKITYETVIKDYELKEYKSLYYSYKNSHTAPVARLKQLQHGLASYAGILGGSVDFYNDFSDDIFKVVVDSASAKIKSILTENGAAEKAKELLLKQVGEFYDKYLPQIEKLAELSPATETEIEKLNEIMKLASDTKIYMLLGIK